MLDNYPPGCKPEEIDRYWGKTISEPISIQEIFDLELSAEETNELLIQYFAEKYNGRVRRKIRG